MPKLRRRGDPPPPAEQLLEEHVGCHDDGVTVEQQVQKGNVLVLWGDCPDGYYVVRCSSASDETFAGHYLEQDNSEMNTDSVVFKESSASDKLFHKSIISVVPYFQDKSSLKFLVNKVVMDDILLKIAELGDM